MLDKGVLRERNWTEAELVAAGFQYYPCRKRAVMARELPASEAPLTIRTDWDILIAGAGYRICFSAGDTVRQSLYEYPPGPSGPTISRTCTRRGTIRIGIPRWRKATSCRSAVHPTIEGWEYGQKDLPHHRSCKRSKVQTRLLCQPAHGYVSPRRAPAWGTPYSMSDEAFCYTSSPTFHTGPPFYSVWAGTSVIGIFGLLVRLTPLCRWLSARWKG
jgi:hypothetical protein